MSVSYPIASHFLITVFFYGLFNVVFWVIGFGCDIGLRLNIIGVLLFKKKLNSIFCLEKVK